MVDPLKLITKYAERLPFLHSQKCLVIFMALLVVTWALKHVILHDGGVFDVWFTAVQDWVIWASILVLLLFYLVNRRTDE